MYILVCLAVRSPITRVPLHHTRKLSPLNTYVFSKVIPKCFEIKITVTPIAVTSICIKISVINFAFILFVCKYAPSTVGYYKYIYNKQNHYHLVQKVHNLQNR